jgi:hypothetical protein
LASAKPDATLLRGGLPPWDGHHRSVGRLGRARKRRSYLEQNAAAAEVELTDEDLRRIDAELPAVAGERYDASGMAAVNL